MQDHRLKIAGLLAGVVVIVGVIGILTLTPASRIKTITGTSADIGDLVDLAAGDSVIIPSVKYQELIDQLKQLVEADDATRTTIIQGVIQNLESWR